MQQQVISHKSLFSNFLSSKYFLTVVIKWKTPDLKDLSDLVSEIFDESSIYKTIREIVASVFYFSCHIEGGCGPRNYFEPDDLYIVSSYPSMKFTFAFPEIKTKGIFYTFSISLNKSIPCKLLLEDKERFTRRPVVWTKEINDIQPAEIEFFASEESTVHEYILTIR